MEHYCVEPDIMTMAKSLAGGFPLSAVTGKAEVMDAPAPGGLGGTYAGSPIACAAAHAVLDVIESEKLCARADAIGELIESELQAIAAAPGLAGVVGDIRGLGAMVAVELVQGGDASKPDAALTKALVQDCAKRGLILLACGVRANVIRFLVPLTASDELIREGMGIMKASLLEMKAKVAA